MSTPGRPKGSCRSAQHEGLLMHGMRGGVSCALAVALAASAPAQAQAQEQADFGGAQISERVRRDAESPMRWIKIHSESVRRAEEAKGAAAAAPATPRRPAAKTSAAPTPARAAAEASAATQAANAAPPPATAMTAPAAVAPSTPALDTAKAALISIDRTDPEWDDELLRTLRKGRVVVRFHVAEDGYLSRMQIVESTHSKLTGPAMAAVMQWRFEPITEPRVATVEFGFDIESGGH